MGITEMARTVGRASAGVLALVVLGGCLGPPERVETREDFEAIRARVAATSTRTVQIRVQGTPGAEANHSAEEYRLTLPEPSSDLAERLVGAIGALNAFASVSNGDDPAPKHGLRLDVRCSPNTVTYNGATGMLGLSFTAWSFGLPAAFWIDDERYQVKGGWEVSLSDAASGRVLARGSIPIDKTIDLCDWERSFSLWDIFLYHAAPIDKDRLTAVHRLIAPHGEADATLALCDWLASEALPNVPAVPKDDGSGTAPPDPDPVDPPDPDPVDPPDPDPVDPPDPNPVDPPDPGPPAPVQPTRAAATFALCIGVEAYAGDAVVPFAAADANRIAARLTSLGIAQANVTTLTDAEATKSAIAAWADQRAEQLVEGDRVVIFFAGRGATGEDGTPLLLGSDATVGTAGETGTDLKSLAARFASAASCVLLLDCAFQGRLEERGPESHRAPAALADWTPANTGVLAAAYGAGEATAGTAANGLFTEQLDAALEAQPEANLAGLHGALSETVRRAARARGVLQQPAMHGGSHTVTRKDG